jgi:phosphonate transport system permease protein
LNRQSLWAILFLAGVIWALIQAGLFDRDLVNPGGWPLVLRFLDGALHPDLTPGFLLLTLNATLTTLAFAVLGTTVSVLLGLLGGLLASQVWWQAFLPIRARKKWFAARAPWTFVRSLLVVLRSVHEVIWGLFFINVIGLDPLTAILALSIPFGAIIGKVFSEILDETQREPLDALLNSGVSPPKAFAYSLLPQAFTNLLSYAFYRFECAIRAAAVLGIIGVGGLGYEIFLSLQTLKYPQVWTLLYALFTLNGLADFWSATLRRRLSQGSTPRGPSDSNNALQGRTHAGGRGRGISLPKGDPVLNASLVAIPLLVVFSTAHVDASFSRLVSPRTIENLIDVLQASVPPRFGHYSLGGWLRLSGQTLAMTLLAVSGAGVLGLALSYPAARNFLLPGGIMTPKGRVAWWRGILGRGIMLFTRGALLIARSVPPPIWALIALFVLFPGTLPGAIALGLYTLGVLGRLMAEVTENLDDRPLVALRSQGATGGQIFAYGVIPLTFNRFVSYLLYRWEEIIRATVVIGLVGAGGLGVALIEQLSSFDYRAVVATLSVFILLTFLVDLLSANIRASFRRV